MKLVSYVKEGHEQLAILANDTLYDMDSLHPELPSTMGMFLNYWDEYFPLAKSINASIKEGSVSLTSGVPFESVTPVSPIPFPASYRKAATTNAGENSGNAPAFQFLSHHAIQGVGDVSCMPDHLKQLDFEAGIAVIISSPCRNINADDAASYIGGYILVNSILGNYNIAGKDIATVLGPCLVTADELYSDEDFSLNINISINSDQVMELVFSDIKSTFASLIKSCAYGADLMPGDIIVMGALDGGYFNAASDGSEANSLKEGDVVEITADGLGISTTIIVAEDSDFSLL